MVDRLSTKSLSIAMLVVGAWLIISPYILSYESAQAIWQQVIGGLLVVIVGAVRYAAPEIHWPSWITVAVGAWLIIMSFALNLQMGVEYWNGLIVGLVTAIVGLWDATPQSAVHHRGIHRGGGAHPVG